MRRHASVEQLREKETAEAIDAIEVEIKRRHRAEEQEFHGPGYFFTQAPQITELEARTITVTANTNHFPTHENVLPETVTLRRWQVGERIYVEHPGFLIFLGLLRKKRPRPLPGKNGQKPGGQK